MRGTGDMDDDGVEVSAHALAAATGSGMGNAHGAAALLDHEAVAGGTRHKANG